jgi:hypothetical protein
MRTIDSLFAAYNVKCFILFNNLFLGLNQLLWYFSDLEKKKCFVLPGGLPDWNKNSEACTKWRRFAKYIEVIQCDNVS